jgi:cell division transport system permease protein
MLQKKLEKEPFVKSSKYYSKEDAAKMMLEDIGADISDLGTNPYFARIALHFNSDYTQADSLDKIAAELEKNPLVADVYYESGAVNFLENGLKQASYIVAGLGLMVLIISLTLIDNTIRLMMYSNRFLIKSMQLVGATRWFIIKPFIMRGLLNGFISSTVAILGLAAAIYWYMATYPTMVMDVSLLSFALVFAGVMVTGLLISTFSTYRAVSKYLTLKLDELY